MMRKILFFIAMMYLSGNVSAQCISGDCKNGTGTFAWSSGDRYEGQYKDGIRVGKGYYRWANGSEYMGDWVNNQMVGFGKITFVEGAWYIGQISNSAGGD